jgi:hypothetical protein
MALFLLLAGGSIPWGLVLGMGTTLALKLALGCAIVRARLGGLRGSLTAGLALALLPDALCAVSGLPRILLGGSLASLLNWASRLPTVLFNPTQVQEWNLQPTSTLALLYCFGCLIPAWRLSVSDRPRPLASLLAGSLFGLGCFSHFYYWTLSAASLWVYSALSPWTSPSRAGRDNALIASASAFAACVAYAAFSRALMAPHQGEMLKAVTCENTPYLAASAYLLYGLFFLRLSRQEPGHAPFWAGMASVPLAVFGLSVSPILLRFDMNFLLHYAIMGDLAASAGLLAWAFSRPALSGRVRAWAPALAAGILGWNLFACKAWSEKYFLLYGSPRSVEDSMRWLDARLPRDSTVLGASLSCAWGVALWTRGLIPVGVSSPSAGNPAITYSGNLRNLGRMLAAGGFDLEAFLRERWEPWDAERGLDDRLTRLKRDFAFEQHERTGWPYFLIGEAAMKSGETARSAALIRSGYSLGPAIDRPFFLWLRDKDAPLLKASPESRGGVKIYDSGGVRIYEFPAAKGS